MSKILAFTTIVIKQQNYYLMIKRYNSSESAITMISKKVEIKFWIKCLIYFVIQSRYRRYGRYRTYFALSTQYSDSAMKCATRATYIWRNKWNLICRAALLNDNAPDSEFSDTGSSPLGNSGFWFLHQLLYYQISGVLLRSHHISASTKLPIL